MLENGVKLKMQDVNEIGKRNGLTFLKSGTTPHHIQFVVNIETFPVVDEARKIKAKDDDPKGVNVNYVENKDGTFYVRTYERGVEDETLACGTGATCVAIAAHDEGMLGKNKFCNIKMPGGDIRIDFEKAGDKSYKNIWLTGPATYVFKGEWNESERYIPRFF
jgi:diaminopimelate epimerase